MKFEPVGRGRSQKYSTPFWVIRRVPLGRASVTAPAGTVVPAATGTEAACRTGACEVQAARCSPEAETKRSHIPAFFIVVLRAITTPRWIVRAPGRMKRAPAHTM